MILVDLNLLLYATNGAAPNHAHALSWWRETMNRDESVGLSWATLLGFLRIATRHGIFPRPLSVDQALKIVEGWLTHPLVTIPRPGDRHWTILRQLLMQTGTAGNLTTDAHLAALAIEHDATLYSSDADFTRFEPELRTRNPLRP